MWYNQSNFNENHKEKEVDFMKDKMRKFLKILLIIICLLVIVFIIYIVVIKFDGFLDKSNPMTKEEVIALLDKGKEYPNYYSSPKYTYLNRSNDDVTEVYVKDNIKKVVYNNEISDWRDYNNDEEIYFIRYNESTQKKYASIAKMSQNGTLEGERYSQKGFDYSLIADTEHSDYNFKYLGEKEIENRICVLVEIWNKQSSKFLSTKFTIDKETGLVSQRIDYTFFGILPVKMTYDTNLKLDVVTEEEVKRPDLTDYEVLQ